MTLEQGAAKDYAGFEGAFNLRQLREPPSVACCTSALAGSFKFHSPITNVGQTQQITGPRLLTFDLAHECCSG